MSVNIKYKNNSIAKLTDTGTKTLKTAGKYCEDDIIVENTKDGGGATEPFVEETYDSSGNLKTAILHGYPVVRSAMFQNCTTLIGVLISDGVTSIGDYAFSYCSSLTSMKIPDSVVSIGEWAFDSCGHLKKVTIGSGVKSIGSRAFSNCIYLTSMTIPASVTSIGSRALAYCTRLASVTFKGTPSSIGGAIFEDCLKLTAINVPWAEGAVPNAPWGATNATINYNYTGA